MWNSDDFDDDTTGGRNSGASVNVYHTMFAGDLSRSRGLSGNDLKSSMKSDNDRSKSKKKISFSNNLQIWDFKTTERTPEGFNFSLTTDTRIFLIPLNERIKTYRIKTFNNTLAWGLAGERNCPPPFPTMTL